MHYQIQKPFWENWDEEFEEIRDAILAHKNAFNASSDTRQNISAVFFRSGNVSHRITIDDIIYLEVGGGGTVHIVTQSLGSITVNQTMSKILLELPPKITRVNRFNAINIDRIKRIDHEDDCIYLEGHARGIDLKKSYVKSLMKLLV